MTNDAMSSSGLEVGSSLDERVQQLGAALVVMLLLDGVLFDLLDHFTFENYCGKFSVSVRVS